MPYKPVCTPTESDTLDFSDAPYSMMQFHFARPGHSNTRVAPPTTSTRLEPLRARCGSEEGTVPLLSARFLSGCSGCDSDGQGSTPHAMTRLSANASHQPMDHVSQSRLSERVLSPSWRSAQQVHTHGSPMSPDHEDGRPVRVPLLTLPPGPLTLSPPRDDHAPSSHHCGGRRTSSHFPLRVPGVPRFTHGTSAVDDESPLPTSRCLAAHSPWGDVMTAPSHDVEQDGSVTARATYVPHVVFTRVTDPRARSDSAPMHDDKADPVALCIFSAPTTPRCDTAEGRLSSITKPVPPAAARKYPTPSILIRPPTTHANRLCPRDDATRRSSDTNPASFTLPEISLPSIGLLDLVSCPTSGGGGGSGASDSFAALSRAGRGGDNSSDTGGAKSRRARPAGARAAHRRRGLGSSKPPTSSCTDAVDEQFAQNYLAKARSFAGWDKVTLTPAPDGVRLDACPSSPCGDVVGLAAFGRSKASRSDRPHPTSRSAFQHVNGAVAETLCADATACAAPPPPSPQSRGGCHRRSLHSQSIAATGASTVVVSPWASMVGHAHLDGCLETLHSEDLPSHIQAHRTYERQSFSLYSGDAGTFADDQAAQEGSKPAVFSVPVVRGPVGCEETQWPSSALPKALTENHTVSFLCPVPPHHPHHPHSSDLGTPLLGDAPAKTRLGSAVPPPAFVPLTTTRHHHHASMIASLHTPLSAPPHDASMPDHHHHHTSQRGLFPVCSLTALLTGGSLLSYTSPDGVRVCDLLKSSGTSDALYDTVSAPLAPPSLTSAEYGSACMLSSVH